MSTASAVEGDLRVISYRGKVWGKAGLCDRFCQMFYTFCVVHYFLWIVVMIAVLIALWIVGFWWLSILLVCLYMPSFLNGDHLRLGRPWHAFRTSSLWRLSQRYMEMSLTREQRLDPKKQYVFGIYPHGILILSRVAMYGGHFDNLFPGIETRVLGATPMFWVPGSREICLWMGAVDANKRTASKVLKSGLSLMVYPGGSKEIFDTDPKSKNTVLILRKGFIKLALQHGADLVPTFVFGEKWVYNRAHIPGFIRSFFMKTLRLPLIAFWGRWFTWVPYRKHMSVVFGPAISVQKVDEPSQAQIDGLHAKFIDEIKRIFAQYKKQYGYSDDEVLLCKEAVDD